jgi:hypothetical protein
MGKLRKKEIDKIQCQPVKQNAQYVEVQARQIKERLEKDGIESFVPDAEVAMVMSIKGYTVTKEFYDGNGNLKKVETTYIPPNHQAAIAFLKTFSPEKYGQMVDIHSNIFMGNNVISPQMMEADIQRIERFVGSFANSGTKQVESHEVSPSPLPP